MEVCGEGTESCSGGVFWMLVMLVFVVGVWEGRDWILVFGWMGMLVTGWDEWGLEYADGMCALRWMTSQSWLLVFLNQ